MKRKAVIIISSILGAILLIGIALNVYVFEAGNRYIPVSPTLHAQVAMILGAAVMQSGIPSPVLQDRINAAVDLYKNGRVDKILMSGGNPTVTNNEVNPVRKVLIAAGVPTQDIFLDHAGFDTYSSMYRARTVFGVSSAIIVTQDFHLPRAVYMARSLGIEAYGQSADDGEYSSDNYVRELLARPKAFIDVLFHRVPKYLGPVIPITGDGSST